MKKIIKTKIMVLLTSAIFFTGANSEELSDEQETVEPLPVFDCLIEPSEIVDVSSPVPGVIQHIYADRGDFVELGMPLSKLNSTVEQVALELAWTRAESTAEVELQHEQAEFSKRLYSRNQALFRKSVISSHDMDRFETEQRVAEMQERQAKSKKRIAQLEFQRTLEQLNRRTILSPIEGVVMERYKSAGEYVDDEPMLRLAQLNPLRIEIIVRADYWGRLLPGQQAEVIPQFLELDKKVATIERIDPMIDSASGTFRVQLRLPNPDHQIAAGLKCQLVFMPEKMDVSTDEVVSFSTVDENIPAIIPNAMLEKSMVGETVSIGTAPTILTEAMFKKAMADATSFASLLLSDQSPVAGPESGINAKSCFAVGPIVEEKIAKQLSEQLVNQSLDLIMQRESKSVVNGYFVKSVPLAEHAEVRALLARLKAKKIRDFIAITDKETNHHLVLLGFYLERQNAINRSKILTAKGFEVELKPRYQESGAFWLNLSQVNNKATEDELRQAIFHLAPQADVKPVGCDPLLVQNKQ